MVCKVHQLGGAFEVVRLVGLSVLPRENHGEEERERGEEDAAKLAHLSFRADALQGDGDLLHIRGAGLPRKFPFRALLQLASKLRLYF